MFGNGFRKYHHAYTILFLFLAPVHRTGFQLFVAMDAAELARWTRFAAKGGIGKCTATHDCIAESADDLMFLKVSSMRLSDLIS